MKFVAPEQAPEQAEIIRNTPFWPDVDLSEFRCVMRTDGTVTQPRLKQVALRPLFTSRAAGGAAGHSDHHHRADRPAMGLNYDA